MPDFDGRDWLTDSDDPIAQMDGETRDLLESSDPTRGPRLHDAANDAKIRLELAQRLFMSGVPMEKIPIDDRHAMEQMLENSQLDDVSDGMDQHRNEARERNIDPDQTRISGKMKTKPLAMLKPTPKRVWTDGVDSIPGPPKKKKKRTKKAQIEIEPMANGPDEPTEDPTEDPTIQDLLDRLENIVDAMGDTDIDPSLAAAATIVARRLLSKLGEMTMDSAGVPEEEPEPSLDEELSDIGPDDPDVFHGKLKQELGQELTPRQERAISKARVRTANLEINNTETRINSFPTPNLIQVLREIEDKMRHEENPPTSLLLAREKIQHVLESRKPEEWCGKSCRSAIAGRIVRLADHLEIIDVPVIPILLDDCLLRLASTIRRASRFLVGKDYPNLCPQCQAAIDDAANLDAANLLQSGDTEDVDGENIEAPIDYVYDHKWFCGGFECANKQDSPLFDDPTEQAEYDQFKQNPRDYQYDDPEDTKAYESFLENLDFHKRSSVRTAQAEWKMTPPDLDDISQKLVDILIQSDGLQSLGVAKQLGVSSSTAKRILKKLNDAGVVVQQSLPKYNRDGSGGRIVFWRLSDFYRQSITQPIDQSMSQPLDQLSDLPIDQSTNGGIEGIGNVLAARRTWESMMRWAQKMVNIPCPGCGADIPPELLTPEDPTCPECGMPIDLSEEGSDGGEAMEPAEIPPPVGQEEMGGQEGAGMQQQASKFRRV